MFERIVVPLDGTPFAEEALPAAREMARLTGASLHLVRVVDVREVARACDASRLHDEERDFERMRETFDACDYLDQVRRRVAETGSTVTSSCKSGMTIAELGAATSPGDLVVIATHGGMNRSDRHSVAWDLIGMASVPVLTIRPAYADPMPVAASLGVAEREQRPPTEGTMRFEPW